MDLAAKRELAAAVLEAIRIHEESWVAKETRTTFGRYAKTWMQAAVEATADKDDRDLVFLVYFLASSEYSDPSEWAQRLLDQQQAA